MPFRNPILAFFVARAILAGTDSPWRPAVQTFEGRIVTVAEIKEGRNGRLVFADQKAKVRRILPVPAGAIIILNRHSATLGDLEKDDRVVVAADRYDHVTEIRALREKRPKNT